MKPQTVAYSLGLSVEFFKQSTHELRRLLPNFWHDQQKGEDTTPFHGLEEKKQSPIKLLWESTIGRQVIMIYPVWCILLFWTPNDHVLLIPSTHFWAISHLGFISVKLLVRRRILLSLCFPFAFAALNKGNQDRTLGIHRIRALGWKFCDFWAMSFLRLWLWPSTILGFCLSWTRDMFHIFSAFSIIFWAFTWWPSPSVQKKCETLQNQGAQGPPQSGVCLWSAHSCQPCKSAKRFIEAWHYHRQQRAFAFAFLAWGQPFATHMRKLVQQKGLWNVVDTWLVVSPPLKNISQMRLLFPIYGKIKNVPNHQPDTYQPSTNWFDYIYSTSQLHSECQNPS